MLGPRICLSICVACAFALLASASVVQACSCVPPPSPLKALKEASAVFVGKVVGRVVDENNHEQRVTLDVQRIYKGITQRRVEVSSILHGSICGFPFVMQKRYLVYAAGDEALSTGICTRTRLLKRAKADLAALGKGRPPPSDPKSPGLPSH